MRLRQQGAISAAKRQSSLNRADDILPLLHLENWGSVGSRREGLTLAADRAKLLFEVGPNTVSIRRPTPPARFCRSSSLSARIGSW
jgi:hypothetical protein